VVVLPAREGVVTHADAEAALAEAVNTATYRTTRRRESRGAAARAVEDAASLVFVFSFLEWILFFFWQ
jgi:hypothetical protein